MQATNKGNGRARENHKIGQKSTIVTIVHNCATTIERPRFWQIVTIVHNSELLRIIKNCYKMLRNVTKNQMLRIVAKCYELLQNVKNCNNSTPVLEYACTTVRLYYSTPVLLRMILIISSTPVL